MRVALVQLDTVWEDPARNHARAGELLSWAREAGAELAVLPEMFATGFSLSPGPTAQPEGGPTEAWLSSEAARLGMAIVAGVAVAREPLPTNEALLVRPGGRVDRYAKLHPFSFAGEERVFAPGSRVVTWELSGLRLTPLVCYDLRFPEPFRLAADGTDAYVVIANWPDRRRGHWRTLLRARAVENLAYVLGVNRVGEGGGLRYAGDSAVVSPWGEELASAEGVETVLVADLDPHSVAEARAGFPALSDRRPAYTR